MLPIYFSHVINAWSVLHTILYTGTREPRNVHIYLYVYIWGCFRDLLFVDKVMRELVIARAKFSAEFFLNFIYFSPSSMNLSLEILWTRGITIFFFFDFWRNFQCGQINLSTISHVWPGLDLNYWSRIYVPWDFRITDFVLFFLEMWIVQR